MYFKKYLIVINEKKNEKIIAIIFSVEKNGSLVDIMFLTPKTETAPKVGIDNKKEILAASYLLKFKTLGRNSNTRSTNSRN